MVSVMMGCDDVMVSVMMDVMDVMMVSVMMGCDDVMVSVMMDVMM